MFRFFRNFRKKLLVKNNFSKYLLYATGEIILIVIGILIALGINNWNQHRLAAKREKFYLEGLKTEFQRSKLKLENLIEVNRLNYKESQKIAGYIDSSHALPTEDELAKSLFEAFSYEIAYNPNNSLLNEILSSGGLQEISNADLRLYLTSWDSYIRSVNRQEAALREQREKVVDIFRAKDGSIKTILNKAGISAEIGLKKSDALPSNMPLIKTREFENNLLLYILTGIKTETSHYQPLLQEIDNILLIIDDELEKA
ncbi:MAG: DUF6090 family protein [Salinimicrobium sp.]